MGQIKWDKEQHLSPTGKQGADFNISDLSWRMLRMRDEKIILAQSDSIIQDTEMFK